VREAARWRSTTKSISEALALGYAPTTNSIIPDSFDFYWKAPARSTTSPRRRSFWRRRGLRKGFDAGDYYCDSSYANLAEAVINNLQEAGIRVKLRPLERAAFFSAYSEKKLKNVIQGSSGAFGNARPGSTPSRSRAAPTPTASYPEIDALFAEQAVELDKDKRTSSCTRIQQILHERSV
jgi:peptide/nickel transport system substrate-binding protein